MITVMRHETICFTQLRSCHIFIRTQVTFPSQCFEYSTFGSLFELSETLDFLSVIITGALGGSHSHFDSSWERTVANTLPVPYCRLHY